MGVFCHLDDVRINELSKSSCGHNETLYGCIDIPSQDPVNFTSWLGQSDLCSKRFENLNFRLIAKNQTMLETSNCKENFKICRDIKSKSKGICIPSHLQCPITNNQLPILKNKPKSTNLRIEARNGLQPLLQPRNRLPTINRAKSFRSQNLHKLKNRRINSKQKTVPFTEKSKTPLLRLRRKILG